MKKSLVALAVLAAAGAASAQSSVTLFGVVDATMAYGKGTGPGGAGNPGFNGTSKTQLTNSGYNSSRLGFRGTEDLGGGMSASFWLEAGLANDDGQGAGTNSNNQQTGGLAGAVAGRQGLTFNRRSTVSLAGNWGEIRLGRDYAPYFWNLTVFDPFGTNGVGTSQILNSQGFNPSMAPQAVRVSNSVGYFLPGNLGGFYGQISHFRGENNQNTGAANKDDGTGNSARFGYANGPVNVAVAFGKIEYTPTPLAFGAPPPIVVSGSGDTHYSNLGASWDFGFMQLMGQISRDKTEFANVTIKGRGYLFGGLVPVGAGQIRVSYSTYAYVVPGTADPKTNKFALGYVHNLSKRTALYATAAFLNNKNGAYQALNGSTTEFSGKSKGYDFGIRHSF